VLSLDRPFTYLLPAGCEGDPGVGSLVKVPFHGRSVRGWVLGTTDDVPARTLAVQQVVSPIRFFDEELLGVARWVGERYVAPLAAVLGRLVPPRVASEEVREPDPPIPAEGASSAAASSVLASYRGGPELLASLHERDAPIRAWVLRPGPDHEAASAVELVAACLAEGRRALVIVPEAAPVPATAMAISRTFGARAAVFLGGSKRARYRMWLAMQQGRYDVVVGTRPAVFAPIADLGLILVSRESHPAHREDRAPYYHVRDVALARARLAGAVCVLSALCPSSEAAASGLGDVAPAQRRWPPVEIVRPGVEGRAPRLLRALKDARRGFLFSPLPGYGIAAFCRACGEPATCRACGGALRSQEGAIVCVVCGAPGRCAKCGAASFGLRRGGAERVEEWAARATGAKVRRLREDDVPRLPEDGEILVGGPDDVRDLGPAGLDLVAILDADLAERRPGLSARERAVTTWMEAIAWAYPHGRAIVQSSHAGDPAVQALVKGKADRFHADEAARREAAGFPVGSAVFRIVGDRDLEEALRPFDPLTLLVTSLGDQTICLLALDPEKVPAFGLAIRELAARDVVSRVEAEPHL
jgi:primosomal protein N' (replication factor Y) (superfamily II helicase)